jgi:hypothetical protein
MIYNIMAVCKSKKNDPDAIPPFSQLQVVVQILGSGFVEQTVTDAPMFLMFIPDCPDIVQRKPRR